MHKSLSLIFITKPAIVIDLDETLVHVTPLTPKNVNNNSFFTIKVKKKKFYVQMRPHLRDFLDRISKLFDIYFFTSADRKYADLIIDKIMPNEIYCNRLYKDSCLKMCGYYVKDLNIIRRPLKQILLIDDFAGSALKNPENLVKIKPWNGETNDKVLKHLQVILESIALDKDLRTSFIEALKNKNYDGIDTF